MNVTSKMIRKWNSRNQGQIRQLLRFSRSNHYTTVTCTNTNVGYYNNRRLESFVDVNFANNKMNMNHVVWMKNRSGHSFSFSSTTSNDQSKKNPFWKGTRQLLSSLQSHDDHSHEQYKVALEMIQQFPEYQSNQVCDWERMYEVLKPSETQYPFVCQLLIYTLAHYYGHTKQDWKLCLKTLDQLQNNTSSSSLLAHGWLEMEAKWYSGKFSEMIHETGPTQLSSQLQPQNVTDNTNDSHSHKKRPSFVRQRACMYNAMAIAHLINNSDKNDHSSSQLAEAKQWLSKSVSLLSQHPSDDVEINAQLALVKSNLVILHILQQNQEEYTTNEEDDNNNFDVLKHWEEALNQLPSNENNNSIISAKTHIYSNMVHYLLHDNNNNRDGKISEKDLKLASQHAKETLDLASSFEVDDGSTVKMIMKRPLWNIAQCFAKTGASAITAEGLYKSCLEDYVVDNTNTDYNVNTTWQQELLNATIQEAYATFLRKSYDNRTSEASIYSEQSQTTLSDLHTKNICIKKPINAWYSFLSLISP